MGKRVGLWDISNPQHFDYVLVQYSDYECYQLFQEEKPFRDCHVFKLRSTVKENSEIFVWYLTLVIAENEKLEIEPACQDSSSGYLISILREFFEAFNKLDLDACRRLQHVCSQIKFKNYYVYRTNWLLEQLTCYVSVLREFFLDLAPVNFVSQQDYQTWWDCALVAQRCLTQLETICDLNSLQDIKALAPLLNLRQKLIRGVNQWAAQRGIERFEAGAGYFLALAFYWFKVQNYQASLLLIHRSMDCVIHLLGHRYGWIIPTTTGLRYDTHTGERVSFNETLIRLNLSFNSWEKKFLQKLNYYRNYLRETHGFRIVQQREVHDFLVDAEKFMSSLSPDVKSISFKEKFLIDLQIPLKLIFEAEIEVENYLEKLTDFT